MKGKSLIKEALLPRLRIEELIGLVIILFALVFGAFSNLYILINELPQANDFAINMTRIFTSGLFIFLFYRSILYHADNRGFQLVRDFMPFVFVLIIYFNLQDAIFIVHPHDVHNILVQLDGKLFGIQPSVWAEQFYHPRLTDWFALCYLNYYLMSLILLAILYGKRELQAFRSFMLTMMICYFIGFAGYIIFPAASPYLVISDLYHVDIWKDTSLVSQIVRRIVDLAPYRVRDAFPSMHNAIVFLTMIMAWRYNRTFFWIQLPLAVSLPFATIYLRYHYAVDVLASILVIALGLFLSPRLELQWQQFQTKNADSDEGMGESGVHP